MRIHSLGYPRNDDQIRLRKAYENYWKGIIPLEDLVYITKRIKHSNWQLQQEYGINLIPVNNIPYYDQVLDTSLMTGNIPSRFIPIIQQEKKSIHSLHYAMAKGYNSANTSIKALDTSEWFNSGSSYFVPEFYPEQEFNFVCNDVVNEFIEAKKYRIKAKPVLLGPVSYLLLGKEIDNGFNKLSLLHKLLPVYKEILNSLHNLGATYVQINEPFLSFDMDNIVKGCFAEAYHYFNKECAVKLFLNSYSGSFANNLSFAFSLPVYSLNINLQHYSQQLDSMLIPEFVSLSLEINEPLSLSNNQYQNIISKVEQTIGTERIWVALQQNSFINYE